jgi:hypothetical protein
MKIGYTCMKKTVFWTNDHYLPIIYKGVVPYAMLGGNIEKIIIWVTSFYKGTPKMRTNDENYRQSCFQMVQ